jgi:hypothetical protein
MVQIIKFEGVEYPVSDFSEYALNLISSIKYVDEKIAQKNGDKDVFLKAKKGFIADLKEEITREKSGVDLASLFSGN